MSGTFSSGSPEVTSEGPESGYFRYSLKVDSKLAFLL